MTAPATMTERTSWLSISRPTTTPAMPLTMNISATAAEMLATENDRSATRAFMYTDRLWKPNPDDMARTTKTPAISHQGERGVSMVRSRLPEQGGLLPRYRRE